MAGAEPRGQTSGAKTGDVVHAFTGGTIQMLTDVVIDPAGNIWAANNWNSPEAAVYDQPAHAISTWGGGSGLTVRRRGPGEDPAHGSGAGELMLQSGANAIAMG